jgi:beta-lactamase superfamily II metal-dependent hydrolase
MVQSLPVTALLLASGGYAPLNPPEWMERWGPQMVLLSVAAGDAQGRPDPQVLQALESHTLLRTDQHGWIEITTDGRQMWVYVERR